MRRYLISFLTIGAVLAVMIFGIVKRQTYTDVAKQEDYLDRIYVAELSERITEASDDDFIIASVFCYEDRQNTVMPVTGDSTYVLYRDVRDNEFFGVTETAIQMMEELKKQMLQLYPR